MKWDDFASDPDGFTKDWLNLTVTKAGTEKLRQCAKVLNLAENTIRMWGYRDKDSQHAYFYRVILAMKCLEDCYPLEMAANVLGLELHPKGTREKLERYRKAKSIMNGEKALVEQEG